MAWRESIRERQEGKNQNAEVKGQKSECKSDSIARHVLTSAFTRTCIRCESARRSFRARLRGPVQRLRRDHAIEHGSRRVRRAVPYRGCTGRTIRGGARSCAGPLPSSRKGKILLLPPRARPAL